MNLDKSKKDFRKFAIHNGGVAGTAVDGYIKKGPSNYLMPYIMEERDLNVSQMDVFSRMMFDRIIFLGTGIDSDVANIIQAQLLYLESCDDRVIQLYINSPGGSVYAGLGIYDTMQFIKPIVKTSCIGLAASMGAVLLSAGAHGHRSALPHSRIMIHQPSGGIEGQESDIQIAADQIKQLKTELYEILAEHTGKTVKQLIRDADRDRWMRAKDAMEYGIIDKVLKRYEKE